MNAVVAAADVAVASSGSEASLTGLVRSFFVTLREPFSGAFKTRAEECGQVGSVDSGTVLALHLYPNEIPSGCRVFVTARDIPAAEACAQIPASAVAVQTDPNGRGARPICKDPKAM
jgi:hypothetical protein